MEQPTKEKNVATSEIVKFIKLFLIAIFLGWIVLSVIGHNIK
jgi:hypothetical protein